MASSSRSTTTRTTVRRPAAASTTSSRTRPAASTAGWTTVRTRSAGPELVTIVASGASWRADMALWTCPAQPNNPAGVRRGRTARDETRTRHPVPTGGRQAALTAAEPVAEVLTRIAAVSREQAAAVGGLYEPFPGITPEPSATPTATPVPMPPPDAAQVLDLLTEAAATARADAGTVPDGRVARLLASMATGRLLLADALTVATGGAP